MAQLRLISADSHVMEPADFWQTRLDQRYRDRAPHVGISDSAGLLFLPARGDRAGDLSGNRHRGRLQRQTIGVCTIDKCVEVPSRDYVIRYAMIWNG